MDSTIIYSFYIGNYLGNGSNTNASPASLYAIMEMSPAWMLKEKEQQEKIIASFQQEGITEIEVTVNYYASDNPEQMLTKSSFTHSK